MQLEDWSSMCKCNYEVTAETKLRSFQTKLKLRTVVANIILRGLHTITIDKYTFCHAGKTYLHLLRACVKIASFWDKVSS